VGVIIVTKGYTWIAILILALWIAIKNQAVMPIPLSRRIEINPIIISNVERMLAMALGLGLFIAGMAAFADFFPPIIGSAVEVYTGP
jgi:hypothetical protein